MYHLHNMPRLITDAWPLTPVLREGEVIYVDGKPVKRTPIRFHARGLVVPLGGRELLLVPEGDRLREQYWLFQNPHQTIAEDGSCVDMRIDAKDKALLFGNTYIVQTSQVWGSFVQARLMRVDVGQDAIAWPTLPKELP